jgi:hypothetical protein
MANDPTRLIADKALIADINKATNFEDMRALLHNATERSGIATRDPQTGQFIPREPLTPAAQTGAPADTQVSRTETIGGKEFTFTGTALEVEKQIGQAYKIVEAVKPVEVVVAREQRVALTQTEKDNLEIQFKLGNLTSDQYLERTGAVNEYMATRGFDVAQAAATQTEQSWAEATQEFFNTEEGSTWKGGTKNLEIASNLLQAHGWQNAATVADKVTALRAVAKEMRDKKIEFEGDLSVEEVNKLTDNMTPAEILEHWKESHGGDAAAANADFIKLGGGTGGMFNR